MEYITQDGAYVIATGYDADLDGNTDVLHREVFYGDEDVHFTQILNYDADGEVVSVEIPDFEITGVPYGETIGSSLESSIGNYLARDHGIFARIGAGTVVGTLGQNLGEFIQAPVSLPVWMPGTTGNSFQARRVSTHPPCRARPSSLPSFL